MFTFQGEFIENIKAWTKTIAELFLYLTASAVMFTIIKGIVKIKIDQAFVDERGRLDVKKFWNFVAYFCATIAFVAINIGSNTEHRDMIWLIYLGIVSGDSLATKLLDYKLNLTKSKGRDEEDNTEERILKRMESPEYEATEIRPPRRTRSMQSEYGEDEYDTVQIDREDGMDEDERNERFYR